MACCTVGESNFIESIHAGTGCGLNDPFGCGCITTATLSAGRSRTILTSVMALRTKLIGSIVIGLDGTDWVTVLVESPVVLHACRTHPNSDIQVEDAQHCVATG